MNRGNSVFLCLSHEMADTSSSSIHRVSLSLSSLALAASSQKLHSCDCMRSCPFSVGSASALSSIEEFHGCALHAVTRRTKRTKLSFNARRQSRHAHQSRRKLNVRVCSASGERSLQGRFDGRDDADQQRMFRQEFSHCTITCWQKELVAVQDGSLIQLPRPWHPRRARETLC